VNDYDIVGALQELEDLAQAEYDTSIIKVVDDPDRLRRLTGIMIKRPFATATEIGTHETRTNANRYWTWEKSKLAHPDDPSSPEYELLLALRDHYHYGADLAGLEQMAGHADSERGLFKIVAGWLHDKLRGKETASLREYYCAAESRKAEALLDLADMVANFALTPVYVALFAGGGFVVPLVLLAAKHGYKAVFESREVGDVRA
jgi:hypothetical protein